MSANLENSTMATGLESSVFIPIPKKDNAKECSNYQTIAFISHASKANLKILQARLQQYVNCEHPDVQAGFRKGRGTRDQIAKSVGSSKKQESSRIISIFALMTMPKSLTVCITTNCRKFWKRWEHQTSWSASREICIQVKKQQLELDMEKKRLFPNQERSVLRLYIGTCLFNLYAEYIMWNARLDEMQAGIKIAEEISITSDMQMAQPLWQKVKKN